MSFSLILLQVKTATISIDIENSILTLKRKMNAVILAHYYQDTTIQDIADFVGDSLELSKKAATTDADIIVFCGVKFMAESAAILNPTKKVLIPDLMAGCSLEESCDAASFRAFREKNPEYLAVTYINCSAEVKALSDIIVTSSNAEKIIQSIPESQKILFSPDRNLGKYLSRRTGREMKLWNGTCVVHENFSERELITLKTQKPKSHIIAHPECQSHLIEYAEYVGSTSSLIRYVTQFKDAEFIVLTEPGIIHQMHMHASSNKYYDVPSLNRSTGCVGCSECPYMRLNTIQKLYSCMLNMAPEITVDKEIASKARIALDRMLALS